MLGLSLEWGPVFLVGSRANGKHKSFGGSPTTRHTHVPPLNKKTQKQKNKKTKRHKKTSLWGPCESTRSLSINTLTIPAPCESRTAASLGWIPPSSPSFHRCPFWLIWLKNGGLWFTWWFNQIQYFPKKGTYGLVRKGFPSKSRSPMGWFAAFRGLHADAGPFAVPQAGKGGTVMFCAQFLGRVQVLGRSLRAAHSAQGFAPGLFSRIDWCLELDGTERSSCILTSKPPIQLGGGRTFRVCGAHLLRCSRRGTFHFPRRKVDRCLNQVPLRATSQCHSCLGPEPRTEISTRQANKLHERRAQKRSEGVSESARLPTLKVGSRRNEHPMRGGGGHETVPGA